jgi:SAM-dependent methyltransferase
VSNTDHTVPGHVDFDAELQRHDVALRRACSIQSHDHVVDIGCGAGHTSRQAARAARAGSVLGIDVSASAIERARRLARVDQLRNVTFEVADAEVFPFVPRRFDRAISRFGTMFFADPGAALANIQRALRPGGRLVMMVWQARDRNEWAVAIAESLGGRLGRAPVDRGAPDAFSLADPAVVTEVLESAGFADVAFADIREPVYYGPDADAALEWVRSFATVSRTLDQLGPVDAQAAIERLRLMLSAHLSDDGVWFDSQAWIVTARRR